MSAAALGSPPPSLWFAIVPLLAVLPAVLCMLDISHHPRTRRFPPLTWPAVCVFGSVLGLLAHLAYGCSETAGGPGPVRP
ncbi:hypothetical protein GCM10010441_02360 [Kitasatospora paracochleata]|uniref:Cardiolipin synthase N-terminal domain-containing protein n=1 Tax=Kitasatospora paracochleata TaxID=58354 RepID=A0ABT1J2I7_9ACTN|nr:hypothetical protein [Kitasatospora paracochleata]MCP2311645.1 hypothetical protein [Kitasatospora paracochleata]